MNPLSRLITLTAVSTAFVVPAFANNTTASVGKPAPDFTLTDTTGKTHKLADYAGKVVVLEWINDGCPFVQRHYKSKNMQTLQQTYTGKDVVWLSICSSNKGQQGNHSAADWEALRQKQGHKSTALLLDEPGTVGRAYAAKTTPHMYVIDKKGVLVYNGAIDSNNDDVTKAENFVAPAIDAALAGKPVAKATSTPYGCGVKY
jgi:peroxiredoxin